jgi:Ca2+-transporting ATPase
MGKSWHALTPEEAMQELKVAEAGLSTQEAQNRLATYGANELRKEKGKSPFTIFLHQFKDVLMIILVVATALSVIMGEFIDALIILVIILVSAILGFRQEYRSSRALEALKKMTTPTALFCVTEKKFVFPPASLCQVTSLCFTRATRFLLMRGCLKLTALNLKRLR